MDGQNTALVARQEVINEITDNRVWLVPQLGYDPTNESAAARVPFQVDRAMQIPCAMNLGPTVRPTGLFGPDLDEAELLLQLRIAHDLVPQ